MGFLDGVKNAIGLGLETAGNVMVNIATGNDDEYQEWVRQHALWEQIIAAMDECEKRKHQKQLPGECRRFCYCWLMVCCLCEVPLRVAHHSVMYFIAFLLCNLTLWRIETCMAQMVMHDIFLRFYLSTAINLICNNLTRPCDPEVYVYMYDVTLERPPEPVKPGVVPQTAKQGGAPGHCDCDCCCSGGKGGGGDCQKCCNCQCNLCDVCNAMMKDFFPEDENRLARSAFCVLSCHHSCHPAPCCGPLCTTGPDGNTCPCCESWADRMKRWNREYTEARTERTREFYKESGLVELGQPAQLLGQPLQESMV